MEAGASGEGATTAVADLKIVAAQNELRTLGGCCKDSDNVLERINTLHDSLSKQGATRRRLCACARDPCYCWPQAPCHAGSRLALERRGGPRVPSRGPPAAQGGRTAHVLPGQTR